jgi:beta-xylosidase
MVKMMLPVAVMSLVVAGCQPVATPLAPTPQPTSAPPTQTPIPPTSTPTPTTVPSPTPLPVLFHDDFDGSLGEGWHWMHERSRDWSLTSEPGWLQIMARAGGIQDGTLRNLLVREAPAGNFELQTGLRFRPTGNFQLAGLLVYLDDQDNIAFGRAYCNVGACVGDGFYMDLRNGGVFSPQNYATKAPETDLVHLRLRRVGDALTGLFSTDGENWTIIGIHHGSWKPLFVGLLAGQAVNSVPGPAQFDYFTITALPE